MKKMVEIICNECGKKCNKPAAEIKRWRKRGRALFYCSISCGAKHSNSSKSCPYVEKTCPHCGKIFITKTTKKTNRTYCGRVCASASSQSMTEARKEGSRRGGFASIGNLLHPEETLKKREMWKYEKAQKFLLELGLKFKFEYRLENFIFDLALEDRALLVEFDGRYHNSAVQKKADAEKDLVAKKHGFVVVRIKVPEGTLIPEKEVRAAIGY